MTRIAYVESKFGKDPSTYRNGYFGGIWQVDKLGFEDTKNTASHPGLITKFKAIQAHFNIEWNVVVWSDLLKPLYSGLAARLFLTNKPGELPETINGQAQYWKTYYNTDAGQGTVQKFIDDINALEGNTTCSAKINLVIVLDGSGSISSVDFTTAKASVGELLSSFDIAKTKMGMIVFSNEPLVIFPLRTFDSTVTIKNLANSVLQPDGGTGTDLAINVATQLLNQTSIDETHCVNVMVIFTDGMSNNFYSTVAAAETALASGITIFAVGIGSGINAVELLRITGNDTSHVVSVNDFDTLIELVYKLNKKACEVPIKPPMNGSIEDSVGVGRFEKRYVNYEIPEEGITLRLENINGNSIGYYSYTVETPSAALNDGILNKEYSFIPPPPSESRRNKRSVDQKNQVFIAIEGLDDNNQFKLEAQEGDTVPNSCDKLQYESISVGLGLLLILLKYL